MQKKSYGKASTYYLVGTILNTGISFLTIPIFTRILSTSDYGIVTTYISWVSILALVIGLAIPMGIRASFIDYEQEKDAFLSVCTTFTILTGFGVSLLVCGAILLFGIDVSMLLVCLCLIQGLSSSIIHNYLMYLMMQYRYQMRTALMVLPNLTAVVISIFILCFFMKNNLYLGRIIPLSLVHFCFGIIVTVLIYRNSHVLFNQIYLKYALAISVPLVIHGISLSILSQSDRIMITTLRNESETGIYSLIYNFSMIATVLTTSLEGIWVPWFTERLKQKKRQAINLFGNDYIHLMTYAIICVIILGPEVVKLMAPPKYWDGIVIIPPIVLSNFIIFAYTLYVNIEHFHKITMQITGNTVIAACNNIVLNFLFIPRYGYIAAAYTTLFSYFLSLSLHTIYAKKLEKKLFPFRIFIYPMIHIIAATIVFYLFVETWYIRWIFLFFYLSFALYIERKRLQYFLLKP